MADQLINQALVSPGVTGCTPTPAVAPTRRDQGQPPVAGGPSFAQVLARQTAQTGAPAFSKHAAQRLERRGIELDSPTLQRLADGVARAQAKGSQDSVVFVDKTAFVVSVKNNTVLTAVDQAHMRDQVFTKIDSAVIA
jgi:flagellar operon protein